MGEGARRGERAAASARAAGFWAPESSEAAPVSGFRGPQVLHPRRPAGPRWCEPLQGDHATRGVSLATGNGPVLSLGTSAVLRCVLGPLRQSRRGGSRLRSAKFLFTPPTTPSSALPAPPARFFSKPPLRRAAREQRPRHTTARDDGGVANGVNKNLAERSWPPRRRPRAPRFRVGTAASGETMNGRNEPQPTAKDWSSLSGGELGAAAERELAGHIYAR